VPALTVRSPYDTAGFGCHRTVRTPTIGKLDSISTGQRVCTRTHRKRTADSREPKGVLFVEAKRYRRSREVVGTKRRLLENLCPPLSPDGVDARLEAIPSESPSPNGDSLSQDFTEGATPPRSQRKRSVRT